LCPLSLFPSWKEILLFFPTLVIVLFAEIRVLSTDFFSHTCPRPSRRKERCLFLHCLFLVGGGVGGGGSLEGANSVPFFCFSMNILAIVFFPTSPCMVFFFFVLKYRFCRFSPQGPFQSVFFFTPYIWSPFSGAWMALLLGFQGHSPPPLTKSFCLATVSASFADEAGLFFSSLNVIQERFSSVQIFGIFSLSFPPPSRRNGRSPLPKIAPFFVNLRSLQFLLPFQAPIDHPSPPPT